MAKKIEMLNDQQEVVHPLTSSDCVIMENGKTLEEVMGDGIATPTVTHEGASFQVGVGDSNIEVVDGDVAGMTLEGQTYQNILPKPTTLIMETDEKEFKINDKIDNNIVLDDNVAEIATIKGQTYVNAVQEESASEYVAIDEELNGQSITTTGKPEGYVKNATLEGMTLVNTIQEPSEANSVVLDLDADINAQSVTIDNTVQGGVHGVKLNGMTLVNLSEIKQFSLTGAGAVKSTKITPMIKPNTKYTRILVITENTLTDSSSLYVAQKQHGLNTQIVCYAPEEEARIETNFTGVAQKKVFITPNNLSTYSNMSGVRIFSTNSGGTLKGYEIILEGDYTNVDIPYFESMQSVKMPVLRTVGKNLLSSNMFNAKEVNATTGAIASSNRHIATDYLKIDNNVDYTFSGITANCFNYVAYYDNNYNFIGRTGSGVQSTRSIKANGGTVADSSYRNDIIPANCKYIVFTLTSNSSIGEIPQEELFEASKFIQLEKATSATPYEPYKSNILSTPEDLELRGIGNVKDELNLMTGELTQRIGEIVLDGSGNWKTDINGAGVRRYFLEGVGSDLSDNISNSSSLLCDKFKASSNIWTETNDGAQIVKSNGIYFIDSSVDSLDAFVNKLKATNIKVQYSLIEKPVKTVDLSIVDQDNNTVKSIQTHPTLTHISTSSQGLIPNIVIPSQLKYHTIIKPSTTYTVQLKQTTVNSEFPLTINLGGTTMPVPNTKFTITTPSELTSQDVIFTGKNNVIGEVVITEGDTTGIEYDYFEGMNDVKSPKMIAVGKNLFDYSSHPITLEKLAYTDGQQVYWTGYIGVKTYVPVKENTTYTYSNDINVGIHFGLVFYDGDKSVLSYINIFETNNSFTSFTTPKGCKFIRFAMETQTIPQWIQLEESSTATSYEPYKGVTIEQDIDSIPLTSDMFEQGYYDYDKIIKGMSIQQIPLATDSHYIERRIYSKSLIKVKPNSRYKVVGGLYGWFLFFDKNGNNTMKRVGSLNGVITNEFTTDSNTYYVGLVLHKENNGVTITPSDIPSDLTLQEVTDEIVLRSIGDVKDTLNLTTGEYVQRIGEIIIDGSEGWQEYNTNVVNTYCGVIRNDIITDYKGTVYLNNKLNKLDDSDDDIEGIRLNNLKRIFVRINRNKGVTNLTEFKQYISQNPLTVQYELATPIIKKVNLTNTTKLPSYTSTTHYDAIVPSNSLVPNIKIPSTIDYNVAIKPSTQYTIRANTTSAMSVNLGGSVGTLANGKVTLTTPSTLAHNSLKLGNGKAKEVMVIEGSEIKDNVPFFNGMKNVQMGGSKLVNLIRNISTYNEFITISADKRTITYTDTGYYGNVNFDSSLLKPNTLYTLYFKITQNTSTINMPCGIDIDGNAISPIVGNGGTGTFKVSFTSLDKLTREPRFVFRHTTTGSVIKIQDLMLFEGDWTHLDEIPYIESEMIIEQPIIRSQGKNLFDGELEVGTVNSDTGLNMELSSRVRTKNYIKIKPNTSYSLQTSDKVIINRIYYFDSSKKYISNQPIDSNNTNKVFPQNAMYIRLSFANQSLTAITNDDINNIKASFQLEEGALATSYEPFKHQTLYSNRVIGYEEGVHYGYGDGVKYTNANYNSVMADVEGLSIAYVTNGSSNFTFWNKDGVFISGKGQLDTALSSTDKNGFIQVPSNAKYMKFASSCATGSNTDYTKATVTGELPLRSLPNGVCDSFNLVTGEYVQRVGEVVLDGTNLAKLINFYDHSKFSGASGYSVQVAMGDMATFNSYGTASTIVWCDKLKNLSHEVIDRTTQSGITTTVLNSTKLLLIKLPYDFDGSPSLDTFKQYLSQNPITVQYELDVPIVRKIGLTAKGVFAEASLGDCDWVASPTQTNYPSTTRYRTTSAKSLPIVYNTHLFTEDFDVRHFNIDSHGDYEYVSNMEYGQYVNVRRERLESDTLEAFKKWLAQNPIKVGYITWKQTSSSYSNIQKPIFFNNVNVQFMNNNVDIQPTLTLQARSMNSYVMNMMKANARYTLKALKNSNSFTIDGTSYGAGTNGTFTSPSTLTNKLLITGQDVQELMIIEGDVTSKQLPYYKGIRSSFDNTDKVEVFSMNKNLLPNPIVEVNNLDIGGTKCTITKDHLFTIVGTATTNGGRLKLNVDNNIEKTFKLQKGKTYTMSAIVNDIYGNGIIPKFWLTEVNSGNAVIGVGGHTPSDVNVSTLTVNSDMEVFLGYNVVEGETYNCTFRVQIEESPTATPYQPHKENTTIINMPTQLETVEVVKLDRVKDMEIGAISHDSGANMDSSISIRTKNYIPVQPNMQITYCNNGVERATHFIYYDINKNFIGGRIYESGVTSKGTVTTPDNCYFIRLYHGVTNVDNLTITKQQYKPIALNSLPNGVKDELIINRATSSAKLIRRVGKVVLDGFSSGHDETVAEFNFRKFVIYTGLTSIKVAGQCVTSNNLPCIVNGEVRNTIRLAVDGKIVINIDGFSSINEYFNYLKQNPLTVYYELAEPVITEIRLKGYPFVYEDGSISLNTDIAPVTRTSYNVNQHQLINSQNETIIRHDKQISDLYDYIEIYLDEIYRMELFKMQLELSL